LGQYFAFGPEETIIWIACFGWASSELVESKLAHRLRQKGTVKARSDSGSRILIRLSIFVSIIIAFLFGTNGITPLLDPFFYLGIALMVAGIALRQWSIQVQHLLKAQFGQEYADYAKKTKRLIPFLL